jgi:hypothetical protein
MRCSAGATAIPATSLWSREDHSLYLTHSDLPSADPCACNLPFVALELVARYRRGTIYCGHEGGIP